MNLDDGHVDRRNRHHLATVKAAGTDRAALDANISSRRSLAHKALRAVIIADPPYAAFTGLSQNTASLAHHFGVYAQMKQLVLLWQFRHQRRGIARRLPCMIEL